MRESSPAFVILLLLAACLFAAPELRASQVFGELDEARLRQTVDSLYGTPYRYGGTSRNGFDCSGFVTTVYRNQGIELPRSSRDMYRVGEPVRREKLEVGDLVFFRTRGRRRGISHVGIVDGPNSFVHANTRRGVISESLTDPYWKKRFAGARRVASPTTFTVSADGVGEEGSDRFALTDRYPFNTFELLTTPTVSISPSNGISSVSILTDSQGDVTFSPQVSFANRLQVSGFFQARGLVGTGNPKLGRPDFLVKLRVNDQWQRVPGFALGFDTRSDAVTFNTPYGDSVGTAKRRGLFAVGSGTVVYPSSFVLGRGRGHAGASLSSFAGNSIKRNLSFFMGIDQQLMQRMTVLGEVDHLFGDGGWQANVGARLSITDDAVIEYGLLHMGSGGTRIDKILKFSFNVPY